MLNKALKKTELETTKKSKEELNKKLSALLIKYQDGRKQRKSLIEFEQPCMLLLRSNRKGEFIEAKKRNGLKKDSFIFQHSNGEERIVNLTGAPLYTFPYADKSFSAYVYHENWAYPMIPEEPLMEFKLHKNSIQNAFSAEAKWQAEKMKAMALNWKWLVLGIGILVVGLILYLILKPNEAVTGVQYVRQVLPNNITVITG